MNHQGQQLIKVRQDNSPVKYVKKNKISFRHFNYGSDSQFIYPQKKHEGPLVTSPPRYDTYQNSGQQYYGHPYVIKKQSKMDRCCSTLGKLLCCYCICDMLT